MEIRRVRPDEWRDFRDLRLRALLDSPEAFGGTYEQSSARTDDAWMEWTRGLAESDTQALFVAPDAGLAGAFHRAEDGKWLLFTMWVDPARRNRGIGRALVDAVVDFVRGQRAGELYLDVTETNDAARVLYERYGFAYTGHREPLVSHPELDVLEMRLEL
jgi:ribosomal protein S18 acetylase RimI-like enzyme